MHQQMTGSGAQLASLESGLEEPSQAVQINKRLRMQDQAVIQKLRQHLLQLAYKDVSSDYTVSMVKSRQNSFTSVAT